MFNPAKDYQEQVGHQQSKIYFFLYLVDHYINSLFY